MRGHDDLARENLARAREAITPEWQITMLFYAAVHAVSHVLFRGGVGPQQYNHEQRAIEMDRDAVLRSQTGKYRSLLRLSRTSRYMPQYHPMDANRVAEAERLALEILHAASLAPPPPPPAHP